MINFWIKEPILIDENTVKFSTFPFFNTNKTDSTTKINIFYTWKTNKEKLWF